MRRITGIALALAVAAAAGCESSYVYRPAENATATMLGQIAARYQIPPRGAPGGDVRIASFGVSKIATANAPSLRTMHVRLVISNESAQPWSFDTREQVADVRGYGKINAGYARADAGGLPLVAIGPGEKRTIDLFFPLPAGADRAGKLPEFDVQWSVRVAGQVVAERTPFERLHVEPLYAGTAWGPPYAFGSFGWYDPFWGPGYIGAPSWYW